jgi:hypothetical protein
MSITLKDLSQYIRYECNITAVLKDLYFYLEDLEELEEGDVATFYADPSRSNLEEHINKLNIKEVKELIELLERELVDIIFNIGDSIKIKLYRALLQEPIICSL